MDDLLNDLLEIEGVVGALLLSQDGLPVISTNMNSDEAETVGALATAMIGTIRPTTDRLASGDLHAAQLHLDHGSIDIRLIEDLALLVFHDSNCDRMALDSLMPEILQRCRSLAL